MMKIGIKYLALVICMLALVATSVSGSVMAAATTKRLSTNYTLVNFGTEEAIVNVSYLKSHQDNGVTWPVDAENLSFTIPANYGSHPVRQYFDGTMPTGEGSVTVSSSQQLGAVVQIQARGQTPTQGAYSGYAAGSDKFYIPLAARRQNTASGLANSTIVVQNTHTSNVNVTFDFYKGTTKTHSETITDLKPSVSFYYDLDLETDLPSPWLGSVVVSVPTGSIAVVSSFFTGPHAMQTFNAFPKENVGTNWVIPLFFSRLGNGLSTVVTVQNLTDSSTTLVPGDVTLDCTKDATSAGPQTFSVQNPTDIAPNASYSFNPVVDTTNFPDASWGGSCRLIAEQDVVVIVQMRFVGGSLVNAASYEAILEGSSTGKTMVAPLIAKRLNNGFASVVAIQNMDMDAVGGQTANVTLKYTPSFDIAECPVATCDINKDGIVNSGDIITVGPIAIPPAQSIQRNHRVLSGADAETDLPSNWQGSLVVTSSGPTINGFVQLTNYKTSAGDTLMAHNAFVRP